MTAARSVSVPEAARLLNLSPTTVRNRIRTGALPAVRCGRLYRIRLDQLLTGRTT